MAGQIRDGKGKGYLAQVDSENRLVTFAVTQPVDQHINGEFGKVWSVPFENIANAGANDYIMYVKNTGDKDLKVTDIRISCSGATQVEVHGVTGTAASGTTVTPVSRTVGSVVSPSATLESGTDITGLTTSGTLFFIHAVTADKTEHLSTSSNIIIPKNKAIAILIETTSITSTGVISIVEAE